jgi:hypothetical protein
MWCEHCQADRAAEASAETKEITCATCGTRLTSQQFGKLDRQMQQARELLDRWSKEPLLEPYSPLPDKHASHLSELRDSEASESREQISESLSDALTGESDVEFSSMGDQIEKIFAKSRRAKFRYDVAHRSDSEDQPLDALEESVSKKLSHAIDDAEILEDAAPRNPSRAETLSEEARRSVSFADSSPSTPTIPTGDRISSVKVHRTDPPPQQTAPATHLNIQQLIEERLEHKSRKIDWMMMAGQWLAYLGVLAMTAGGAVIVYGYFGGAEGMTPRGWMLTTAGQMLLFLGIVTLISNGMERSSEEITDRIDILGEQLFRFEAETRAHFVKGPKLSAETYAENADSREQVPVEQDVRESV